MEYSLIDSLPSGTPLSNLLKACYHHIFNDSGNPCLFQKMQVKEAFGCGLLPSRGKSNGCACSITKKQGLIFQNLWNVSSSCIEFSLTLFSSFNSRKGKVGCIQEKAAKTQVFVALSSCYPQRVMVEISLQTHRLLFFLFANSDLYHGFLIFWQPGIRAVIDSQQKTVT
jgi:hypothetical protein